MAAATDQGRPRVCLVGTAPPRRCGIATFTDDLRTGLAGLDPPVAAVQVALTDAGQIYDYRPQIVYEIQASEVADYRAAGNWVEQADVDVVCVQHEFGIFGGPAGLHITEFLDRLRVPVVTTLHTVLAEPEPEYSEALLAVAERSDRIVVLADQAVGLLDEVYGIRGDKVVVIPHGVPDLPFMNPDDYKAAVGAEDRMVLMTFGLLGPDKGIEVAIEALPDVVAEHPEVLYIVLGATHPTIVRHHGEEYRESLAALVAKLGLEDHVVFLDRYVELEELSRYLAATDLYITPYHHAEQIVSGTLAYAVGMGRGVVSTPYRYAKELLAEGRGRLVPFDDPGAMAATILELIGDREARNRMRRRAYDYGRHMAWPAVASAYNDLFAEVVAAYEHAPAPWVPRPLPSPSFAHLSELTDDVGLLQHAPHGVVDRADGYCTDDVGRALVAALQGVTCRNDAVAAELVPTYLSFLRSAQRADGSFANVLSYDRRFLEGSETQDTLGQAVWGLGTAVGSSPDKAWRATALPLVERALPAVAGLTDIRSMAYAVCGLASYLEHFAGGLPARRALRLLVGRLETALATHRRPGWEWVEDELTYANAAVPLAFLRAGRACGDADWVAAGRTTLDFLLDQTYVGDRFDFVGNDGWFRRGGRRAVFGQQVIEAGYTVLACMAAYEATGGASYRLLATAAAEWLMGRNRLGQPLYDPATGRCADGLDRHGVSTNTGAESVVCALLALLALAAADDRERSDAG